MSKTVVIHQPDFLPYLGFFHRFLNADLWVIFDDVQFLNNSKSWHNRDKIKTQNGEKWLSISVQKCAQKTPINQVLLSETNWRIDNLNFIKENYKKSDYFNEIMPFIRELYEFKVEKLVDFNLKSISILKSLFNIEIETVKSSELKTAGKKNELLIDILKQVKATNYLTGSGSRAYLNEELFKINGLKVIWQNFKHPVYSQINGDFIPYLSSIDLLFNCGIEKSRKILRGI